MDQIENKTQAWIRLISETLFWALAVAAAFLLWNWDQIKYALIPMAGFLGAGSLGLYIMWSSGPGNWKDKIAFSTLMRIALSIALLYIYLILFFNRK